MSDTKSEPPANAKGAGVKIPDSVQILIVTVAAYLCVFAFEAGYCDYFGIEGDLIRPDLTTFLIGGCVGIAVLGLLYQIGTLYSLARGSAADKSTFKVLLPYVIYLIVPCLVLLIEGFGWRFLLVSILILCDLVPKLVFPWQDWRTDPQKRSYGYHLSEQEKSMKETPAPTAFDLLDERGKLVLAFVIWLLILMSVANGLGRLDARYSDKFLYREVPRKEVVLRIYGGTAITARCDDDNKVYPEFRFLKLEDTTNAFVLKKTGKLKPVLPK